jgi:hypothetical protein
VQGKEANHDPDREEERMPQEHAVSIDQSKPLSEEPGTGHNRWHEDIEPVVEVDSGDTVVYETLTRGMVGVFVARHPLLR